MASLDLGVNDEACALARGQNTPGFAANLNLYA